MICFFSFWAFIYYEFTFIRPSFNGQVIDKETGKLVPYALVRYTGRPHGFQGEDMKYSSVWYEVEMTDQNGKFHFGRKIVERLIVGGFSDNRFEIFGGVVSSYLEVNFPGYLKYSAYRGWNERFKGSMDIYLERPKTAEEAVSNGVGDYGFDTLVKDKVTSNQIEQYWIKSSDDFLVNFFETHAGTIEADKIFLSRMGLALKLIVMF